MMESMNIWFVSYIAEPVKTNLWAIWAWNVHLIFATDPPGSDALVSPHKKNKELTVVIYIVIL